MRGLVMALLLLAAPAFAVQPDEILGDPQLEARAREISQLIRCPVCQGENIDESNAPIARDLRLVIRERLVAGDGDQAVIDFVVARYGEFVLFKPARQGANLILWLAGPALLLAGLAAAGGYLRRRGAAAEPGTSLSAEEEARLRQILKE